MTELLTYARTVDGFRDLHTALIEPADPYTPALWSSPVHLDTTIEPLTAGAVALGATNYEIPATNVRFVSPAGTDTGPGTTTAAPWRTLAYAIANAAAGDTIVIRAGIYHESLTVPAGKPLTFQAYPGEVVWLDGSQVVTGWTEIGGVWVASYSKTWPRGLDFSGYGGADANRVMADQVWVAGVALTQVADGTTPGAGEFSVNQSTDTLTIGTDPTGKEVRAAWLETALVASSRMELLGIGVRRYSPTYTEWGTVGGTVRYNAMVILAGSENGSLLEHCWLQESAVASIHCTTDNNVLRRCTLQDNGHSGVFGNTADGLLMEQCHVRRMNRGRWNAEPNVAGIKLTRSRDVVIRNNIFDDVWRAKYVWLDVSCLGYKITNNVCDARGSAHIDSTIGIEVELSDGGFYDGFQHYGIVAGNRVYGMNTGFMGFDSGYLKINNNEFHQCRYSAYLWQDDRWNNDGSSSTGATPAEAAWFNEHLTFTNNVFVDPMTSLGSPIQVLAYDREGHPGRSAVWDGVDQPPPPATITGVDMFDLFGGNSFAAATGTMVQLGTTTPDVREAFNTTAALAAAGTSVGGPWAEGQYAENTRGGPASPVPLDTDTAAALGLSPGFLAAGAPLPAPVPAA